jgi:hypothetical protein
MKEATSTMGKEEREAILVNALAAKVKEAKGKVCRFDCSIGSIILGRWFDDNPYFWVEGDDLNTYIVKGKRFFNVSGGEVRAPFEGETDTTDKKTEEKGNETNNINNKKGETIMTTATKTVIKPAAKTTVIPKGGATVKQLDYDGNEEQLNAVLYCNKITCKCGNVRYVKNADVFQVKMCKPCVKAGRTKKIIDLKKSKADKKPADKKPADKGAAPKGIAPSKLAASREAVREAAKKGSKKPAVKKTK